VMARCGYSIWNRRCGCARARPGRMPFRSALGAYDNVVEIYEVSEASPAFERGQNF
jgi:hypothetical protein